MNPFKPTVRIHRPPWETALGVLCAEAQADGVPCFELGRDCERCPQAVFTWEELKASGALDAEDAPDSFHEWIHRGAE